EYIKDVKLLRRIDLWTALGFPEVIHAHVVGNPHGPWPEFSFMIVLAGSKRLDNFNENFLENIFSQFSVLYKHVNGCVDLVFVTAKKFLETFLLTTEVRVDKVFV